MSDLAGNKLWKLPEATLYPTAGDQRIDWRVKLENTVSTPFVRAATALRRTAHARVARRVAALEGWAAALDDEQLDEALRSLRGPLRVTGLRGRGLVEALALVRELARRHLGQHPYDVQVMGASVLLSGRLAEMETGEGKTLTAGLAAAVAGLAGHQVHVITANDYLAGRDAEALTPFYAACGLSVGVAVTGQTVQSRKRAYLADVTYCSNKEVAFDFMRDRLMLGSHANNLHLKMERLYKDKSRVEELLLRGLRFAIVDEADSILVDESRTPLIISGETDPQDEQLWAETALELARRLTEGRHYRVVEREKSVKLTEPGRRLLRDLGEETGGIWKSRIRREDSVEKALAALHVYRPGEEYLVREGKIEIIDEYTGRVMPDRTWSEGLHQLIEVKEDCRATGRRFVRSRMTYQRFFRRYGHLCGMTGTAREVSDELWQVYRLPTVVVPTNRPVRRRNCGYRICRDAGEKWSVVAESISREVARGRPVLVGTRSVRASEELSARLEDCGIEHKVLNAAQDRDEAEIIAAAGQAGRVTVATNMAGRGVDIRLGEGVAERGGLHVILTERHDAGRIDRQLFGRCGRQGDPGSYEEIISWEDSLIKVFGGGRLNRFQGEKAFRQAQLRAEKLHSSIRRDLLSVDQSTSDMLAYSATKE